jgi:type IV secretory pathway VirB4 component
MNLFNLFTARHSRAITAPDGVLAGSPDAVEVGGRWLQVGDEFTTTVTVTGWPSEVGAGWLEPLLSYPGRIDVSWHIEPVPAMLAAQRLRKQRTRLESSRRIDAGKGRLDDPELDAAAADAADLAARMARGEGRLFRAGVYITVHAETEPELHERAAEVRALAASLLMDVAPSTWRQLQAWITSLPFGFDAIGLRRTMDTDALAASFPFTSPDLPISADGDTGVLFGLNLASAGVVTWDRWAQDNYNAVILARSGAGKSYLAKLDLLRNLYLGVEAFVIDPEDEYLTLAHAVGGTIIRPGAPGVRINPFDLVDEGDEMDALTRRALFAHTFVNVLLAGEDITASATISPDEAVALDVAVLAAYRDKGITTDPRTWRRPAPLLGDVATGLRATDEAGRRLAARLAPFVTGSFKGLFDGPTSTVPQGHLVVYAIKDLPDELKPVGTLLTLDAIWRTVSTANRASGIAQRPEVRRMVLIDEAWLLLSGGLGAQFLSRLAKSSRKYGAGLTVVTQDAADVLSTQVGRAVVSNAATQVLLKQAPQAIDAVTEAFGLTDGERAFLLSATRGDALLAAGSSRVAFHALADEVEAELITTGPTGSR